MRNRPNAGGVRRAVYRCPAERGRFLCGLEMDGRRQVSGRRPCRWNLYHALESASTRAVFMPRGDYDEIVDDK